MINLLPPQTKETYRYARRNRTLLRWAFTSAFWLAGGTLLAGGGYLYLNKTISDTTHRVDASNQQLQNQNLASVQKQVTDMSNNLKLSVQVLSQEVLFSKMLTQLATVMPSNTVLTGLTILQVQGAVDITANTANYQAATQLQINLADPKNQIFSKADIVTINCTDSATYPCAVTIRALFAQNNPFLFTNDSKGTSP